MTDHNIIFDLTNHPYVQEMARQLDELERENEALRGAMSAAMNDIQYGNPSGADKKLWAALNAR